LLIKVKKAPQVLCLTFCPVANETKRRVNYSRANLRIFGWASELAESQERKKQGNLGSETDFTLE
jgi:hypothetical protein